MSWTYEGPAVVETVEQTVVKPVRIVPTDPYSPGWYAFLFQNGTGALLSPKGAQAFQEGRKVTVRTERVYICSLPKIVAHRGTQRAQEAA